MSALVKATRALLPAERAPEKAVFGAGAYAMERGHYIGEYRPDGTQSSRAQRQLIREALAVYHTDRHIKRAEQVIDQRVSGLPWHLEEPDGTEVTDDSPEALITIRDLLEKPTGGERVGNQPLTRREQWGLTVRHAGLVNVAFWYLDEINKASGWPARILYVRPDRMTPGLDDNGELTYWAIDANDRSAGTRLELEEVLPFYLEPPDFGFYGRGLVEAAMDIARKTRMTDRHELDVLSSGGRLAGIFSPKGGTQGAIDPTYFDRLQQDLRNVVEMPDAAKRAIVARAPVDFVQTSADMEQLQTVELSRLNREEKFGLWGVDPQLAGYPGPGGLNSGDNRQQIEASTWKNACQTRVDMLWEVLQFQLLDRLGKIGIELQLVIDTPTFEDDTPKYEMAQKATEVPLTQKERRAILGLPPFDDERDNEVWLGTMRIYGGTDEQPPGDGGSSGPQKPPQPPEEPPGPTADKVAATDGGGAQRGSGKATELPLTGQRAAAFRMGDAMAPVLEGFLAKQRDEIVDRLVRHESQIRRKPGDLSVWWDEKLWKAELEKLLLPFATRMGDYGADTASERLDPSADTGKARLDPVQPAREQAMGDQPSAQITVPIYLQQQAIDVTPLADAMLANTAAMKAALTEREPTVVNVPAPVVNVPAPIVNVASPVVNVEPFVVPAPVVNVAAPEKAAMEGPLDVRVITLPERKMTSVKRVKRDKQGLITEVVEQAIDE